MDEAGRLALGRKDTKKALAAINCKGLLSLAPRDGLEPPT